jgi:uncharacterized protein (DUF1697 family)
MTRAAARGQRVRSFALMADVYVALLRGINLGGHHRVPMAALRDLVASLSHEQVTTYVQSGNVVFAADGAPEEVAGELEAALAARFGFEVPVVFRNRAELERIAARHPFESIQPDPVKLHVFFLAGDPDPARVAALRPDRFAPDELVIDGREVYVHFPNGMGRSKLSLDLGTPATARNWRTVQALRELTAAVSV